MADQFVVVRRQWNNKRRARYRLSDFWGARWDNMSGGINRSAPRMFIHGYVLCDQLIEGDLAHSCRHGRPPHRIKVCVTKKDNDPAVFAAIEAQAGANPNKKKR